MPRADAPSSASTTGCTASPAGCWRCSTSGVLGEVQRVEFDYSIPHFVVKPGNIRLDGDLGGGSFMDVGCYAVDLMRAAWGEPTVVSAAAVLSADDPRVDLQTDAVLELAGRHPGPRPLVVHRRRPGQHVAAGHRGCRSLEATSVIVPQWGAVMRVTAGDRMLIEEKAVDGENSYARQLEHVVAVAARRLAQPAGRGARRRHDDESSTRSTAHPVCSRAEPLCWGPLASRTCVLAESACYPRRPRGVSARPRSFDEEVGPSPRGCSTARGGTGARRGGPVPRARPRRSRPTRRRAGTCG